MRATDLGTPAHARPKPDRLQSESGRRDPIGTIARRDMEARNKTTGEIAGEFQAALQASRAFSWIGIYEHRDPGDIPAIEVYLAERDGRSPAASKCVPDVVDIFADLTLSLRPHLTSHLHLIQDCSVPQLKMDLGGASKGRDAYQLVLESEL